MPKNGENQQKMENESKNGKVEKISKNGQKWAKMEK